jgi:hypothetical protein
MATFQAAVFFILILIIILLLFILKIFWEVYATSITLKLLQNNTGNLSTPKIIAWVFIFISIVFLINFFSKKQTIRPSLQRSSD